MEKKKAMAGRRPILAGVACAVLTACGGGGAWQLQPTIAEAPNAEMAFNGTLNQASVDAVIALAKKETRYLVISSPGGEVTSSMKLGLWLRERGITLVVKDMCLSSCANYLFLAAPKKVLLRHSVVAWHGSVEQKNFRVLFETYSTLRDKSNSCNSCLSADERSYLETNRTAFNWLAIAKPLQRDFFGAIDVSEYLTRAGQEEDQKIKGFWTYSVADLLKAGVCCIEADEDYGSEKYNDEILQRLKLSIKTLPITESILAKIKRQGLDALPAQP